MESDKFSFVHPRQTEKFVFLFRGGWLRMEFNSPLNLLIIDDFWKLVNLRNNLMGRVKVWIIVVDTENGAVEGRWRVGVNQLDKELEVFSFLLKFAVCHEITVQHQLFLLKPFTQL